MERHFKSFQESRKNTVVIPTLPELQRSNVVGCFDIEGPWYLGDLIDEAMARSLVPKNGYLEASPSYGQIIYHETWEWFSQATTPRETISPAQEGTYTIFPMILFLAQGVGYQHLEELTLKSKQTTGSQELVARLQKEGINVFGITTAPQQPYQALVRQTGILDERHVIGSPFPIDETRELLQRTGVWEQEIAIVQAYLQDCYQIINEHSKIISENDQTSRTLSETGSKLLKARIAHFHTNELGVSYDHNRRQLRETPKTLLGQVVEGIYMLGDRAKVMVAVSLHLRYGRIDSTLVAVGDGLNDTLMLQMAPISIGINGPDAAKAAKIAVVTEDMRSLWPIFEQILVGQRDMGTIIHRVQQQVGSSAIVCRGGPAIPKEILDQHRATKKKLRGDIIY